MPWKPLPWNSPTYSQLVNRRYSKPNMEGPKGQAGGRREEGAGRLGWSPEGDSEDKGIEDDGNATLILLPDW